MYEYVEVRSQRELEEALKREGVVPVCVGRGRFTVEAFGSATVRAFGSATVEAFGSATVRASGSATVEAFGSATVRASGSATVRASKYVAVTRHGETARVKGGVLIQIPDLSSGAEWCEFHGITSEEGTVVLFKAVRDDYCSRHGADYSPGATPAADDWNAEASCGGGLHFCARPWEALRYDPTATRFVACPVSVDELVVIGAAAGVSDKVKAPKVVAPCYEVDRDGEPLAAAVA